MLIVIVVFKLLFLPFNNFQKNKDDIAETKKQK